MVIYAILVALSVIAFAVFVYGVYKTIWYIIKLVSFTKIIKKLTEQGADVQKLRKKKDIFFGKKGEPDFIITCKDKKYEISVLSFISTHGRWNIEKTRTRFFIESRRGSKFFYKMHVNSNAPEHVREYKNEVRISRKELYITPIDESFEKQIFLLYPYPKRITYTNAQYNEVYIGNEVEGHVVLDIKALNSLFFEEKQKNEK